MIVSELSVDYMSFDDDDKEISTIAISYKDNSGKEQVRLFEKLRWTGHWVYGEDESGQDGYSCTECDFFVPWYYKYYEQGLHFIKDYHLCPQCGAKMDEEVNDNE